MAATPEAAAPKARKPFNIGLVVAVAALAIVLLLPPAQGLPVAGQRMLAVFCFAVIVWMTEALDYAVSAVVIAALMALLLGISPDVAKPDALMGTARGLGIAASGFANTALALVAAALFLAAAMTVTGLDRRIALVDSVARRHRDAPRRRSARSWSAIVLAFLVPSDDRARRLPGADHDGHHRGVRRRTRRAASPRC